MLRCVYVCVYILSNLFFSRLGLSVRTDVEIHKENDEKDHEAANSIGVLIRHATVLDKEELGGVEEDDDKLQELQLRQVPLPPQVLLNLGSEAGQQVVAVHDHVD